MEIIEQKSLYNLYTYSYHEDEQDLCYLEMRALFGYDTTSSILVSNVFIDPSRSPFIKERIEVIYEGTSFGNLVEQVKKLSILKKTFKVQYIQNRDLSKEQKVGFEERRKFEREIGLALKGKVDLSSPDRLLGIMQVNGRWVFGRLTLAKAVWFKHQNKLVNYSTALGTRLARAIVNIAVPSPMGIKAIDPCCGIGTVLIEALSMNINIVGSDINPLVLPGTRRNITHFGFSTDVTLCDIRGITDDYDVAIIDMPYNLCSVLPWEEQLEMLQSARRFAEKAVIITIEPLDLLLHSAGFEIIDRCVAKKSTFSREVLVCT